MNDPMMSYGKNRSNELFDKMKNGEIGATEMVEQLTGKSKVQMENDQDISDRQQRMMKTAERIDGNNGPDEDFTPRFLEIYMSMTKQFVDITVAHQEGRLPTDRMIKMMEETVEMVSTVPTVPTTETVPTVKPTMVQRLKRVGKWVAEKS